MHTPFLRLAAASAGLALAALASTAAAQTPVADKPAAKPVRSIPYVSITADDGRQRHYETNNEDGKPVHIVSGAAGMAAPRA